MQLSVRVDAPVAAGAIAPASSAACASTPHDELGGLGDAPADPLTASLSPLRHELRLLETSHEDLHAAQSVLLDSVRLFFFAAHCRANPTCLLPLAARAFPRSSCVRGTRGAPPTGRCVSTPAG